jgi:dolichyl-phosphate-mannose-protein mannosyltransferase
MAASKAGFTTGVGGDQADIRQRHVAGYEKANGGQVVKVEAEDTKKLQKVRLSRTKQEPQLTSHQQPKSSSFLQTLDDYEFLIAPLIFTAFALFTRLWKIGLSPIVTWDEAQYVPSGTLQNAANKFP